MKGERKRVEGKGRQGKGGTASCRGRIKELKLLRKSLFVCAYVCVLQVQIFETQTDRQSKSMLHHVCTVTPKSSYLLQPASNFLHSSTSVHMKQRHIYRDNPKDALKIITQTIAVHCVLEVYRNVYIRGRGSC